MRNKKGLTLVEVVVAMGLFGVIMVTLFPAFLITNLMNITSREFTDANFEAQSELEEIYDRSKLAPDPQTVLSAMGYETTLGSGSCTSSPCIDEDSLYRYVVSFTPNAEVPSMMNLLITVSKPSGHPDFGKDRAELELVLKFGTGIVTP